MDDSKIVDLYWARSEDAIAQTDAKYGRYCYSIASNILPFREDAQESVNDTWLAAWNALPPNRPQFLSAFLGKLTRRISIDRWRHISAEKRGGGTMDLALEELAGCIPGGVDPVAQVEAAELVRCVNTFLAGLPTEERQVFLMRYFELASISAIAERLRIGISKTKTMLHRTRKKLRAYLEKEGY